MTRLNIVGDGEEEKKLIELFDVSAAREVFCVRGRKKENRPNDGISSSSLSTVNELKNTQDKEGIN